MIEKGTYEIDGYQLAYQIEGEGIPVFVIGSAVYYPRLFSQKIREKLKLIFVDHRGHAKPSRQQGLEDYTIERILADMEQIRERLDLKDFVIMGHSGNAFLAFEYAKRYAKNVQKVILLNTAPTNSKERQEQSMAFFQREASPERKEKFEQDFALLDQDIQREPERRFAHLCIRMGAQSFYDYQFDSAPLWEGVYTNMPAIDYLWGEAFAKLNLYKSLKDFDKPVFLGLGKYDYLVGPYNLWDDIEKGSKNIKKIIFEHSGHNPMFEEPQLFDEELIKWLES